MKKAMFFIILTIITLACTKENEPTQTDNEIQLKLRVKNDTPFRLDNVFIEQGGSQNNFGPLQPDEISDYKSFIMESFGYPYIKVSTQGQEIEGRIQPTEKPKPSNTIVNVNPLPLTCVITINEYANNALDIYFIK